MLNNVIHHIGYRRTDGLGFAASKVIKECLRVARQGITIIEMTVPLWVQKLEQATVALTGGMATFVFNRDTLRKLIEDAGPVEVGKWKGYRLGELVGNWTPYRGMIILPVKIPAGSIPYTYMFCEVRKPPTMGG